jgi:hypothetical protein
VIRVGAWVKIVVGRYMGVTGKVTWVDHQRERVVFRDESSDREYSSPVSDLACLEIDVGELYDRELVGRVTAVDDDTVHVDVGRVLVHELEALKPLKPSDNDPSMGIGVRFDSHYEDVVRRIGETCDRVLQETLEALPASHEAQLARTLFRLRMHDEIERRAETDVIHLIGEWMHTHPCGLRNREHVEAVMWERETEVRAACETEARRILETWKRWQ